MCLTPLPTSGIPFRYSSATLGHFTNLHIISVLSARVLVVLLPLLKLPSLWYFLRLTKCQLLYKDSSDPSNLNVFSSSSRHFLTLYTHEVQTALSSVSVILPYSVPVFNQLFHSMKIQIFIFIFLGSLLVSSTTLVHRMCTINTYWMKQNRYLSNDIELV